MPDSKRVVVMDRNEATTRAMATLDALRLEGAIYLQDNRVLIAFAEQIYLAAGDAIGQYPEERWTVNPFAHVTIHSGSGDKQFTDGQLTSDTTHLEPIPESEKRLPDGRLLHPELTPPLPAITGVDLEPTDSLGSEEAQRRALDRAANGGK